MGDPAMNLISPSASTRKNGMAICAGRPRMRRRAWGEQDIRPHAFDTGTIYRRWSDQSGTETLGASTTRDRRSCGEEEGITICLEALNRFRCYLLNTMDDLADHIDGVGHPIIRGMYDVSRQYQGGRPHRRLHAQCADVRARIHISEN